MGINLHTIIEIILFTIFALASQLLKYIRNSGTLETLCSASPYQTAAGAAYVIGAGAA